MTDLEYIAANLGDEDILCQIAEEAAELAKAALKLRRVITGTNPTPVTNKAAVDCLIEEYADIEVAFKVWAEKSEFTLPFILSDEVVDAINYKTERWAQQIKEGKKHD